MKNTLFTKIAITAISLNLVGCSGQYGGGGANSALALLALSVPAGAAIAFSDDSNSATIQTNTPRNNNNGGTPPPNNMNGMDGNDMMGGMPMPPADTMPPTVTNIMGVRGTGANDNQITWTVTFSEAVTNIEMAHFVLSNGGTFGTVPAMSSGNDNTITFTTTHTDMQDGMVTLMFDASAGTARVQDLAMNMVEATADLTSSAVDIIVFPPGTNYLAQLPMMVADPVQSAVRRGGINFRNFARTTIGGGTGGVTTITLDTGANSETYTFTNPTSTGDFLLSDDNDMAVYTSQGTNLGYTTLFSGVNVDGTGTGTRDITNIDLVPNISSPTPSSYRSTSTVAYTGTYELSAIPSGSEAISSIVNTGDFTININFAATGVNAIAANSGTTAGGASTGSFSNGLLVRANNALTIGSIFFVGSGDLTGETISLEGGFGGAMADEILLYGESSGIGAGTGVSVMGLRGSR